MTADAVLIAGPTASGKSAAALALAERIDGALINSDSMQVYREARILTARPGDAALSRAPHLLYGHVGVREIYSAARYQTDAQRALKEVRAVRRTPIFVGGTGLYFTALTEGLSAMPPVPQSVRASVRARHARLGAEAFFAELAERDPETAARLRPSDTQRVLRAGEILEAGGRSISEWQRNRGVAPLAGLNLARFVLSPPRAELHRRIDARFEQMLAAGALEEARRLMGLDPSLPSAKILGLRELWSVLDGASTPEPAKAVAKAAARQYAKRQLTWFRHRMADWTWVEEVEQNDILEDMLRCISSKYMSRPAHCGPAR
ncbi:MAG: tRNA (adenosine(37)-N6)-dimethylallyltransferase MiaA [Rhizomicrobium sp.]